MPKAPDPNRSASKKRTVLISLALIALTWLVFGQTLRHEFINFDDQDYVFKNPHVLAGLTPNGLMWAFTTFAAGNWHPLTWISHMVDAQIFGLNAGGHHFTNVLLHSLSTILLFLVLHQMTNNRSRTNTVWRCAFVAAIFALHPLRVESVDWVSERKDVLSALFFMLTLGAYLRYARQPSAMRYLATGFFFALGLMAKPMLVTIPLVLMIIDFWPLGRLSGSQPRSLWQLFVEKIPLLLLSLASSVVTWVAQGSTILAMEQRSVLSRLETALSSVLIYIGEMFWPVRLAPAYPFLPDDSAQWLAIGSAVLIVGCTILFFVRRRRQPYLLAGWLWYLVMLIPVIGLVQVGMQSHADRYTYLPQIGLYILAVWAAADAAKALRTGRMITAMAGIVIVLSLAGLTWRQESYWHDSKTLWTHTLAVTNHNGLAEDNLGKVNFEERAIDAATAHFEAAVRLRPNWMEAHGDLGNARFERQRYDDAITEFKRALALSPKRADTRTADLLYDLGNAYRRKGDNQNAIGSYRRAAEIAPDRSRVHFNWGNLLREIGRLDEAIEQYRETLRIEPKFVDAHNNLALALAEKGLIRDSIREYEEALQVDRRSLVALNNLASELAASADAANRDPRRALELAERAASLAPENPTILRTLATAYSQNHQLSAAVRAAELALGLAQRRADAALTSVLQRELTAYKSGLSYDQLPP